jgi:LysR substrate binding domain
VIRSGHPLAAVRVTARRLAAAQHVSASRRGRFRGPLDSALAAQGLEREVIATVGSMGGALQLAATTDLVATVPASVARSVAPTLGLRVFALPPELELEPVSFALAWHARYDTDPAHTWLRSVVYITPLLVVAAGFGLALPTLSGAIVAAIPYSAGRPRVRAQQRHARSRQRAWRGGRRHDPVRPLRGSAPTRARCRIAPHSRRGPGPRTPPPQPPRRDRQRFTTATATGIRVAAAAVFAGALIVAVRGFTVQRLRPLG